MDSCSIECCSDGLAFRVKELTWQRLLCDFAPVAGFLTPFVLQHRPPGACVSPLVVTWCRLLRR